MACCDNLVFIEEEQQTIHFTHDSVKQYLLLEVVQELLGKHYVDVTKANEDADAICVTYLNFLVFNKQVARIVDKSISTTSITSTIVKNSVSLGKFDNKIALNLLRQDDKSSKLFNRLLKNATNNIEKYR